MDEATTHGGDGLASLRSVADYQFGAGAGRALFPPTGAHEVRTSASGRPRQVFAADDRRVVSYGTDGRLTLGVAGGRRLVATDLAPRVVVGEESEPYVREGRNAFAKFVRSVDERLRPGDEAVVVVVDGDVVGVGRAVLWPAAMRAFETGVAVEVRHGAGDPET